MPAYTYISDSKAKSYTEIRYKKLKKLVEEIKRKTEEQYYIKKSGFTIEYQYDNIRKILDKNRVVCYN